MRVRAQGRGERARLALATWLPGRGGGDGAATARRIPPTALVLLSMCSVQVGAALAKGLFPALGPGGAVLLRVGFAAVLLLALWRPRLRGLPWPSYRVVLLYGVTVAAMNLSFYLALSR